MSNVREVRFQAFNKEFTFHISDYFREAIPYLYPSSKMMELHLPNGEDIKPSYISPVVTPVKEEIELSQSRLDTLQSYYD